MPEDVDIYIGIKVNTEELEKANQKLKELLDNFTKAKEIGLILPTQTATQGIENLGRAIDKAKGGVIDLSTSSGRLGEVLSGLSGTEVFNQLSQQATKIISIDLGIPGDRFKQLWDIVSKAPTSSFEEFTRTVLMEGKKLGLAGEDLKAFQDQALALRGIQAVSFDLKIKAPSLKDISDFFGIAQDKIDLLAKAFAKLGAVKAPVIKFKEEGIQIIYEDMERLGKVYEKTSLLEEAARSAHLLQAPALDQLSTALRMNKEDLVKYGQEMEKSTRDFQLYRAYMIGMRGEMGPLGYAFRDVTMQVYWASLGFLFLTMTMTRAERSALTMKNRTFELAQAYYNLSELQKNVTETALQYGAGSEQARNASVQLAMAQERLKLQEESLLVATKADILQGWQMQLSVIPLTINATMAAITAFAALRGILFANTTAKMNDALATVVQGSASTEAAGKTALHTSTLIGEFGAATASEQAQYRLATAKGIVTGVTYAQAFAESLAIGMLTLGIGIVIAYAASQAMMALATAQAEEQVKKLMKSAKESAASWNELGNSILGISNAFTRFRVILEEIPPELEAVDKGMEGVEDEATGKSLDRSLLKIITLFDALKRSSEDLKDISIQYSIKGTIREQEIPKIPDQNINLKYILGEPPILESLTRIINLEYSDIPRIFLPSLNQEVALEYETEALALPKEIMNIQRIMPDIVKKGDLTLNISFPNLIVREEADIKKISREIDNVFQASYYGIGGTPVV